MEKQIKKWYNVSFTDIEGESKYNTTRVNTYDEAVDLVQEIEKTDTDVQGSILECNMPIGRAVMDYIVIVEHSGYKLAEEVTKQLSKGYQPYGSPFVHRSSVAQVLVKALDVVPLDTPKNK